MKRRADSGFGAIAAIMVLVILAALAGAIMKFGTTQHLSSAQDMQSARAWQAAKAGTEWGLYQAFQNGGIWHAAGACNGAASRRTLDLSAHTGFRVTVQCNPTATYAEGESAIGTAQQVRGFQIVATACNSAGTCPDDTAAVTAGYVERVRQVIAFCPVGTGAGQCP
ncbi:MSHA biogenesis protein MshP [Noviherbaspirillum aerium]|uniref:MSHA biogenesis protein MshP n=1 Tax=Noviherbaspirillum aerium TaxID=2588497 RepID=UPI00124DCFDC|nr:MSHA biogenesis protein MshP [Noviherbaspirillum aerium]